MASPLSPSRPGSAVRGCLSSSLSVAARRLPSPGARLGGSGRATARRVAGAPDRRRLVLRPGGGRQRRTSAATILSCPANPCACLSRYRARPLRPPACQRASREALEGASSEGGRRRGGRSGQGAAAREVLLGRGGRPLGVARAFLVQPCWRHTCACAASATRGARWCGLCCGACVMAPGDAVGPVTQASSGVGGAWCGRGLR
jgi:hypothetical protein